MKYELWNQDLEDHLQKLDEADFRCHARGNGFELNDLQDGSTEVYYESSLVGVINGNIAIPLSDSQDFKKFVEEYMWGEREVTNPRPGKKL